MAQFWLKKKEKLNVQTMCSVQFCAPVLFLLCKKFTTYCLKSVPMCSVIWTENTFPLCYTGSLHTTTQLPTSVYKLLYIRTNLYPF